MNKLFISHSSQDDAFVRELQQALADQGLNAWIDSRDLLPGGLLDPDIKKAIDEASAFAVVVSPDALQSRWVGKEIQLRARRAETARQGQVSGHPALTGWHPAWRAGGCLWHGADLHF